MTSHDDAAKQWLIDNPQAYQLFTDFALELCRVGKKFGAKMVSERIRWECHMSTTGTFKWNNNYTSSVARKFAVDYPEYRHLLSFRTIYK